MTHPRVASRHPLKGAEGRGSGPACAGLDSPKKPRPWRGCGLQGMPEARQSRFLGIRWNGGHALRRNHPPLRCARARA